MGSGITSRMVPSTQTLDLRPSPAETSQPPRLSENRTQSSQGSAPRGPQGARGEPFCLHRWGAPNSPGLSLGLVSPGERQGGR